MSDPEVAPWHARLREAAGAPWRLLYQRAVTRLEGWPIDPPARFQSGGRAPRGAVRDRVPAPHVGYYLWHFPVLSQTFIVRELTALRNQGLAVTVFAQGAEDLPLLGPDARALMASTRYLEPVDRQRLRRYRRELFRRGPALYLNLFAYVVSRRYRWPKRLAHDRKTLSTAVYLAGHLRDAGVTHVHAPWADRSAFAALLAARLLDLPFSLQVRAHDLHDPAYQPLLPDLFRNAAFVVTNTRYNRPFIEAHIGGDGGPPVHTIYNGLDLVEIAPPSERTPGDGPLRILCVARLIEQKGLVHLLEACARLRERGVPFRCEIVGAPEEPLYTAYLRDLRETHDLLGLAEHVRFAGALPFSAVRERYARADIFVLPCVVARDGRRDVTPNALIEAMATGLPVISTPVAGVPEIVEDGVSGVLVPPGDAAALAGGIERLAADPAARAALGAAARQRIEDRFDARRNVRSYLRLFGAAASGEAGGPETELPERYRSRHGAGAE